jgi:hypothetical protein
MAFWSFLGSLDNSSLFDFDFFDVTAIETVGESLGHLWLFGLKGEEVLSSSNLELGDFFILLDEDGYGYYNILLFFWAFSVLAVLEPFA